jgi:hypothetical protein
MHIIIYVLLLYVYIIMRQIFKKYLYIHLNHFG